MKNIARGLQQGFERESHCLLFQELMGELQECQLLLLQEVHPISKF